jgi:uncharacterized protein (DUF1501 family)
MSWDVSRRVFLRGAGLAALGVGFRPSSLLVRTAEAAEAGPKVLVHVFLRGGCDGLNLVVPYGDSIYYDLRTSGATGGIALGRNDVVPLDSYFGLNPALAPLKALYDQQRLAFVHAVGCTDLTRSHFDAQDFTMTGTPGNRSTADGWLDRTIARIPGSEVMQGVAFASQLPRAFLGVEPVLVASNLTTFDIRARTWHAEAEGLLRSMYEADSSEVGRVGKETFAAMDVILRSPAVLAAPSNGAVYPNVGIGNSLRQAAQIIKAGLGTRCIFVDVSGAFDTHANQLPANATEFARIADALVAFDTDLGVLRDDVVLLMSTEFGRAAFVNGTLGTDHGTAHCAIVMGGRVRGGQVRGRWPGLAKSQLYQERDLAVGTDFRDLYAEVVRVHLGVDAASLFPGYTPGPGVGVVA